MNLSRIESQLNRNAERLIDIQVELKSLHRKIDMLANLLESKKNVDSTVESVAKKSTAIPKDYSYTIAYPAYRMVGVVDQSQPAGSPPVVEGVLVGRSLLESPGCSIYMIDDNAYPDSFVSSVFDSYGIKLK